MKQKLYDVAVVAGSYSANGQEKKNWLNVGAVYQNEQGNKFMMLKAFFNPAAIERQNGQDSIPLYLFPPKDKQNGNSRQQQGSKNDFSFDTRGNSDDLPF